MKKTLFTMMAVALCGTAFADTFSITTSQLKANNKTDFTYNVYGSGSDVTLIVDQSMTFDNFSSYDANSFSLKFEGEATAISIGAGIARVQKVVAVSGDSTAATYWAEQLLSATEEPAVITLVSGASTVSFSSSTFMGVSKNGTVTLGDTEMTYLGTYTSMTSAKNAITDTNQVALVRGGSSGNYTIALVGKATAPATPEPATATLSLLALAGLASRRRRH